MKETQLKDDWNEGYVYFGAYSKMKDAAGKFYSVAGQETDPILKNLIIKDGDLMDISIQCSLKLLTMQSIHILLAYSQDMF